MKIMKKKVISLSLEKKVGIAVFLFSVMFFISALLFSSFVNKHLALVSIVNNNYDLARSLAIILDQDYVIRTLDETGKKYESLKKQYGERINSREYLSEFDSLKTAEYYELLNGLEMVEEENNISWINFHVEYPETGKICLMIDTDPKEDGRYSMGWESRMRNWKRINSIPYEIVYDDYDGFLIITAAPIYRPGSDNKEVAGYITIAEEWMNLTDENLRFALVFGIILSVMTLIFMTVSVKGINRLVVRPVKSLADAAEKFRLKEDKRSESHIFSDVGISSRDEIKLLADSMSDMETDICSYMNDLESMTRKHERMSAELDMAARIQTMMLPEELQGYNGVRSFRISALTRPAREVGGDFYDYFAIDEDHIGLTVADVSDKGVPAALFMVISKTLIKGTAHNSLSPSRVISRVNNILAQGNKEGMFVTVFFGIYSVADRKLSYVNAGHEDPVVYRKKTGRYELIRQEHDLVIGLVEDMSYTERILEFDEGDRLFVYTDGVPETWNENDEAYGLDRLLECQNRNSAVTGDALLKQVMDDLDAFAGGKAQFDDITMLLLDIDGNGSR